MISLSPLLIHLVCAEKSSFGRFAKRMRISNKDSWSSEPSQEGRFSFEPRIVQNDGIMLSLPKEANDESHPLSPPT